jgi:PKD repeat protein
VPTITSRPASRGLATLLFLLTTTLATLVPGFLSTADAALPDTSTPVLTLNHVLRTTPFEGSSISMKDDEGSAYVARDNSLWLVDDDGKMIYEVNPSTGALKRTINATALAATPRFGGGQVAGTYRYRDLESMAYDESTDTLYAFSGSCCTSTVLPTAFRLTRQNGSLQLESYQPLPAGSDFTASDWNPADGKIYVGISKNIRTYDYVTNVAGPTFQISGLSGILGLDFSADGKDAYFARSPAQMTRVDWTTKTVVPGWTFDLTGFGMLDARGVALIGDQFFVSDGYDHRAAGDPVTHSVFVFDVSGSSTPPAPAPTASFTASPTSGEAPLSVAFTDTSSGSPTSWSWSFGDGQSSTGQNPTHVFSEAGTYTVTLTASNSGGSSSAAQQISVDPSSTPPPPPPPTGGNLIHNPDFENDLTGWDANGAVGVTLTRVAGGHSGSYAAKLTNTTTGPVTETLNDNPNTVLTSAAGTYTGSIWVRADTAGAKLYLRVREYNGGTKVSEKVVGVVLSTSWQQVSASLVPTSPGSTSIEFATAVYSAAAGSSYYADDASLTLS